MSSHIHNQNTLYHDANEIKSHCCRMAIAYKNIQVEHIALNKGDEALLTLNPYSSLPMWTDRDVMVYDWRSIFEYIEERYPAPSLLPPIPSARAQIRTLCYRVDRDWLTRLAQLQQGELDEVKATELRKMLADEFIALIPHISKQGFMGADSLTYLDLLLAAILWRLPVYGISLPKVAVPLVNYAKRIFELPFFKQSLTAQERAIYLRKEQPA